MKVRAIGMVTSVVRKLWTFKDGLRLYTCTSKCNYYLWMLNTMVDARVAVLDLA